MTRSQAVHRRAELSERDLASIRQLGFLGAFLLSSFGVIHAAMGVDVFDPLILRAGVAGMCAMFAVATLFLRDGRVVWLVYVAFSVVTAWLILLVYANRLLPDYSLSLILVVAGACTGFRHRAMLTWYSIVVIALAGLAAFMVEDPLLKPGLFTAQIAAITLIAYVIASGRIRMQAELAESEERLALAARASREGWWDIDLDLQQVKLSDRGRMMLGIDHTRDTVSLGEWLSCFVPEDVAGLQARFEAHAAGRSDRVELEHAVITPAGDHCWLLTCGTLVRDDRGRPYRLVGSHSDITARKQVEQTLLEQQRSMSTLLRNLPGMAYRCRVDDSWTMELASDGALALTGYPPESLIGNGVVAFGELMHPADRDRVRAEVLGAVRSGEPFQLEYRITTADGEEKWLNEHGQPVTGEDGASVLEGFISDVTEQKRSLEALRRSARENELLVDVFRTCALETDEERITQRVTEALQSFFGAWSLSVYFIDEAGEALRLTGLALARKAPELPELVRGMWSMLPLAGDNPLTRAVRSGAREHGSVDDPRLSPDVRSFLASSGMRHYHVVPIVAGSEVAGVAAFCPGSHDIDEDATRLLSIALGHVALSLRANRLQEVRRRTLIRLRTLAAAIEQLPDAVSILDAQLAVQLANPAWFALTGQTAGEVYGRPLAGESGIARVASLAVEHGGWSGERPLRRPDGSVLPVSLSATPVYDEQGGLTGILQIARDLTDEKKLQAEQMRASRLAAIGELSAGVAHEVNNPLGAISMTAELLLEQPLPDELAADVRTVLAEARRAGGIVRNLLAFARQDSGTKAVIDVADVVQHVARVKRGELAAAGTALHLDIASGAPPVLGDAGQLQQVLHNLLTNAQQAINGSGCGAVRIAVRGDGAVTEIVVEDTGPGISEAVHPSLFVPFFTTKPFGEGTGLGLAISYGIVSEHDGEIAASNWGRPRVEGGAPGEGGARFVVRLPAAARAEAREYMSDTEPAATTPAAEVARADVLPAARVLVVDDEEVIGRMVQRFLRAAGWGVDVCATAEAAIARIESHAAYDVVLSDIHMPGVGGRGLFDYLSIHAPALVDSVIFMSGDVVSAETDAFLRRTGRPVLAKPFDLQTLRGAVLEALASRAR